MLRVAVPTDIPGLQQLERAANAMFGQIGMDVIADYPPTSAPELLAMISDRRAWVVIEDPDRPVASLLLDIVDGNGHVEQIAVHPEFARRRLGATLLLEADKYAIAHGLPALTLTTFSDVPWNAPYYERLGFRALSADEFTEGERAIRDANAAGALGAWPRVTMKRMVASPPSPPPTATP
jgi:ribosomal protein S18 acetylase RimI-like enzyme